MIHYPEELSGGEMHSLKATELDGPSVRIAISRASVTRPEPLLCDEPTRNLGSAAGDEVLEVFRDLPELVRRSVVMVTHDPRAAAIGDRVIRIRDDWIGATDV
jgi:putative ABC transport system ATP-binding protein